MNKKNEFSDLVQDIDRKFKDIEDRKLKVEARVKKLEEKEVRVPIDERKLRLEDIKEKRKLKAKEKFSYVIGVFFVGQILTLAFCFNHPQYFFEVWGIGTIAGSIICVGVVDYLT